MTRAPRHFSPAITYAVAFLLGLALALDVAACSSDDGGEVVEEPQEVVEEEPEPEDEPQEDEQEEVATYVGSWVYYQVASEDEAEVTDSLVNLYLLRQIGSYIRLTLAEDGAATIEYVSSDLTDSYAGTWEDADDGASLTVMVEDGGFTDAMALEDGRLLLVDGEGTMVFVPEDQLEAIAQEDTSFDFTEGYQSVDVTVADDAYVSLQIHTKQVDSAGDDVLWFSVDNRSGQDIVITTESATIAGREYPFICWTELAAGESQENDYMYFYGIGTKIPAVEAFTDVQLTIDVLDAQGNVLATYVAKVD